MLRSCDPSAIVHHPLELATLRWYFVKTRGANRGRGHLVWTGRGSDRYGDLRQRDDDPRRGGVRRAGSLKRNAPSLPAGGRKRPKAPSAACRPVGRSGSDGRREALRGKGC